jgi:hypothetical protein
MRLGFVVVLIFGPVGTFSQQSPKQECIALTREWFSDYLDKNQISQAS